MLKEKDGILISEGAYGMAVSEGTDWMRLLEERVFGASRAPGVDPAFTSSNEYWPSRGRSAYGGTGLQRRCPGVKVRRMWCHCFWRECTHGRGCGMSAVCPLRMAIIHGTQQHGDCVCFHSCYNTFPLSGLKQHKCLLSLFWNQEAWNQGVGITVLFQKVLESSLPCLFSWLVDLWMHHSLLCLHRHMACFAECLCVCIVW